MEDRDAEIAVGVDIGVVERASELERRWSVRVVGRKGHGGEEVAAVVERVGIKDYEADVPGEDVVVFELRSGSVKFGNMGGLGGGMAYFNINPFFLGEGFVLVH